MHPLVPCSPALSWYWDGQGIGYARISLHRLSLSRELVGVGMRLHTLCTDDPALLQCRGTQAGEDTPLGSVSCSTVGVSGMSGNGQA